MAAAIIPDHQIMQQRNVFSQEILGLWQEQEGKEMYAIMCPYGIDCECMSEEEIPRLRVSSCHFPGELDYFVVVQPFQEQYGFRVTWYCLVCRGELSCGVPNIIPDAG